MERETPEFRGSLSVERETPEFRGSLSVERETPEFRGSLSVERETPEFRGSLSVERETPEFRSLSVEQGPGSGSTEQAAVMRHQNGRGAGEVDQADLRLCGVTSPASSTNFVLKGLSK